jgi:hypothetical protein
LKLHTWQARGAGGSHVGVALADGTMHAHISEIPTARYKKGHRHGDGVHIWAVTGMGYSLLWNQGDKDLIEVPWRHGVLYVPELWMFHQHFNTSQQPARYLAISLGSRRYPFTKAKRDGVAGETDLDIKKGGRQIEYADQDPRVHRKWLAEIAKTGVTSDMGSYIDERRYSAKDRMKAKPRVPTKAKAVAEKPAKKPKAKVTARPKAKRVKVAAMARRKSASAKSASAKSQGRKKAKAARRRK